MTVSDLGGGGVEEVKRREKLQDDAAYGRLVSEHHALTVGEDEQFTFVSFFLCTVNKSNRFGTSANFYPRRASASLRILLLLKH